MSDAVVTGVVILGAGGLAREVADYIIAGAGQPRVLGFVEADRSRQGVSLNGTPILGALDDVPSGAGVRGVAGAGEIGPRRRQIAEMAVAGIAPFTVIHPAAVISGSASVGAGSIVAPCAVVSANSRLGEHVLVNYGATVGHDVAVGDCSVIGPGARISGWVSIEEDCYFGAGAIVLPKLTVGRGAVVGAGAVVTRDVAPGAVVMGVPARERESGAR